MDIYRITRTKHGWKPEVRYGTAKRVAAIIRQAKQDNDQNRRAVEWFKINRGIDKPLRPVIVKVERAPVGEFTDVTTEFMGK